MSVIMTEDHNKIVRKIKRRAVKIHLILVCLIVCLLAVPYIFKIERDLLIEAYRMAKMEFNMVRMKQELITSLRSTPISVGQALDVADIIISQREVPIPLVLGIITQESDFRPEAMSNKGARGLMQIMPLIFKTYIHSPVLGHQRQMHDPVTNVRIGISYIGDLRAKYGDWRKVLRAYQAGPQNAENRSYDWYATAVLRKAEKFQKTWRE